MAKATKRRQRMMALRNRGITDPEIGERENPPITRQRVLQLLGAKRNHRE